MSEQYPAEKEPKFSASKFIAQIASPGAPIPRTSPLKDRNS